MRKKEKEKIKNEKEHGRKKMILKVKQEKQSKTEEGQIKTRK